MLIMLNVKVRGQLNQYQLLVENQPPAIGYHDRVDLVLHRHQKQPDFTLKYVESLFIDMYRNNFYNVCYLCNDTGLQALCLICGANCCLRTCGIIEQQDPERLTIGNCYKHSLEHHNGICAFLDCTQGRIVLYEGRKLTLIHELFQDQFFNPVSSELSKIEFKTFSSCRLVDKKLQAVRQSLIDFAALERITQEVFRRGESLFLDP